MSYDKGAAFLTPVFVTCHTNTKGWKPEWKYIVASMLVAFPLVTILQQQTCDIFWYSFVLWWYLYSNIHVDVTATACYTMLQDVPSSSITV